ncbi:hypothetical protein IV01_22995 [Pseudomonas syringae]|uniref:Uncharacterized protein n=1 Tax=Pseudomonas syringae TaxID=317 RepID=A0A085V980_PSESX|nr:hypothetical protein IV01_22995 [Pseudomonas syringae]
MPANQAQRYVRQTTSSFFASKLCSHRDLRCVRQTTSSFFAGKPRSHRSIPPLERGLPANQALRYVRHATSSLFASKLGSCTAMLDKFLANL